MLRPSLLVLSALLALPFASPRSYGQSPGQNASSQGLKAAQAPQNGKDTAADEKQKDDKSGDDRSAAGRDKEEDALKPYAKVIPADAKHFPGVFTVHQVKQRWYFQIPANQFGKDFLWVTRLASAPERVDRGGERYTSLLVTWERRENNILLRQLTTRIVADPGSSMASEVRRANESPILAVFPVVTAAANGDPVIEVTRAFLADIPVISAKSLLNGQALDEKRSFLESIHSFEKNIEMELTATYSAGGGAPASAADGPADKEGPPKAGGALTAVVHLSLIRLSDTPMRPRLADDRVGFFFDKHLDFSRGEVQHAFKANYIWRYRLEKKDPALAVSDVVQPITYYIDPATPPKFVPYIRAGVAEWSKAFELAGFRNAIRTLDVPDPATDPDWSQEDVRHSMIRWLPSDVQNAIGASIKDPRTGEVLNASISVYYNVIDRARQWYFLQASPLDPAAQRFPLSDDLMGRLVQYIVAHEVGHTLGLEHNFLASSEYPLAKLRDPQWVKTMGHTPSIMDYARFNYVAQPEDHIDPVDLIPRVGPYDVWAIHWGYAPIPSASSPDEERATLDAWAREQDRTPWLRFQYPSSEAFDPAVQAEAVGDADPVESARLGILNLHRVLDYLYPAMTTQAGASYADLAQAWKGLGQQFETELHGAAGQVGGLHAENRHVGQSGPVWTVIPADQQRRGLQFVMDNVFKQPPFYDRPDLMRLFAIDGGVHATARLQRELIDIFLNGGLLSRLKEEQATYGPTAYSIDDLLKELRGGIWTELLAPGPVRLTPMRRDLEISHVAALDTYLNKSNEGAWYAFNFGASAPSTNIWVDPVYRGELQVLGKLVRGALPRAATPADKAHLEYVAASIDRALKAVPTLPRKDFFPVGIIPTPVTLNNDCPDLAFCPGPQPPSTSPASDLP